MSLLTGKKIHQNSWTVLPATKDVIQRVNQLAQDQGQRPVNANFKYEWGNDEDVDYSKDNEEVEVIDRESIDNEGEASMNEVEIEEEVAMEVGDRICEKYERERVRRRNRGERRRR